MGVAWMKVNNRPKVKDLLAALMISGAGMISYASFGFAQTTQTDIFSTDIRGGIDDPDGDIFSDNPDDDEGGEVELFDEEDGEDSRQAGTPVSAVSPVAPLQSGNASNIEDEPFAATGFRLGTFNANASLEQTIGYSSNLAGSSDSEGGLFSQTDVDLTLTSDWARHELRSSFSGSYRTPINSDEIDRPSAFADMALRLDLIDGVTATTRGFYNFTTQRFTSDTIVPGTIDTPTIQTYGGSVEVQRSGRKLGLTLRGGVDRTVFGDADLGGGVVQLQDDRNNNLYQVSARVSYETSPALRPFVEGIAGWRIFDDEVDRNGNRRDSEIYELRGGVEIDLGEKFTGEISAGFISESFDDPALATLDGVTLNGELEWSPERDTVVRFTAGTQLNGSISAGESGSLIYTTGVDIERQVTARTAWNAFFAYEFNDNADRDTLYGLGVGLEYWINRHAAFIADFEYEIFESDAPGDSFDETSARLGVRFQR